MAKLWAKGYELDALIEAFTVGNDYRLDLELVVADCAGSIAHARMLESIDILSPEELAALVSELRSCAADGAAGSFEINRSDEDCHTAIENRLTKALGDAGKKIHTGRSRNDQVLTALKVAERSFLLEFVDALISLVRVLLSFASEHERTPMPGRTHLQIAMPSTVGLWSAAYAEQLADQLVVAEAVWRLIDRCPLGSAAGYGVPLPINREMTAELLGFSEAHNNVIAVGNSRGETDGWLLSLVEHTSLVLSRLAQDLILFSMPEFGYFKLPDALCTGSSIMPQKKNPDVLELMRARSSTLSGYTSHLSGIVRSMPSGYNRDLQETKEPILKGMRSGLLLVRVAERTMGQISVDRDRLTSAFTPGIYATDAAYERVLGGMSFRDAYRTVANELDTLSTRDPESSFQKRTHRGAAMNLALNETYDALADVEKRFTLRSRRVKAALRDLFGDDFAVYSIDI